MNKFYSIKKGILEDFIKDSLTLDSLRTQGRLNLKNYTYYNGYNSKTIKEYVNSILADDFPETKVYLVNIYEIDDPIKVAKLMEDDKLFMTVAEEQGNVFSISGFTNFYNTCTDYKKYYIRII